VTITVYDSLLDVPLDPLPESEGDDRLVPGEEGAAYVPAPVAPDPVFMVLMVALYANTNLVVPFRGPLKPGRQPTDVKRRAVIAMKRSLAHADCYPWLPNKGKPFTGYFGRTAKSGLRKFTRLAAGVAEKEVYDREAHRALARYYDPYSIEHLLRDTLDEREREAFLAQLMYLYNRRYGLRYTQARPWDGRKPPVGLDCSATGEWGAKWAGLKSPSGYSGWGYGNTDTQLARFRALGRVRESIASAKPGDPKYYGRGWDPSHVAWYIGHRDGKARVFSFGSYPAGIYAHDYRHDGIATCNLTGR